MQNKNHGNKSLAFERKGGRLKVLLEEAVPMVKLSGETYFVTESPSITVNKKKHFVEGLV